MRSLLWVAVLGTVIAGCDRERVDLRDQQTAGLPSTSGTPSVIRNQGGRTTCITFGAMAVLEAEYRRAGHGELDLSEQFLNHFGKMNWLHPWWDRDLAASGASSTENQVALFAGGGAVGYLVALADGTHTVEESLAPYLGGFPYSGGEGVPPYGAPEWNKQDKANEANLWPLIFPYPARRPERTFGTAEVQVLCDSTGYFSEVACESLTTEDFEDVLREGHPIAIDARLIMRRDAIWAFDESQGNVGDHAMAIVGFDKTDPLNPYFIVKNSWGETSGGTNGDCGEGGFTCVDYEFVRRNVYAAGYVRSVPPPSPWPELGLLGRWPGRVAGEAGRLDLYHLPGSFQVTLDVHSRLFGLPDEQERRAGTWRRADGTMFRVNGEFLGREAQLELSPATPNLRYGDTGEDTLRLVVLEGEPWAVAGLYLRPGGDWESAFGVLDYLGEPLTPAFDSPRPLAPESWIGRWEVRVGAETWELLLTERQDFGAPSGFAGLDGRWLKDGLILPARLYVSLENPDRARIDVRRPGWVEGSSGTEWIQVQLAHDATVGIFTGHTLLPLGTAGNLGVLAQRTSTALAPRIITPLTESVHEAFVSTRFEGAANGAVSYQWTSSLAGAFGTTAVFNTTALGAGRHEITLTVRNAAGEEDSASITVYVQDSPPEVTWLEPDTSAALCADTPLTFRVAVDDRNETIPEENVSWWVGDAPSVGTGRSIVLSHPPDTVRISVYARDSFSVGAVERTVTFQTCTQEPPTATITSPPSDVLTADNAYAYDGYDEAKGMWFTDVLVQGTGSDPEDGSLSGTSLQWSTNQTSLQSASLGSGTSRTVRLYSNVCTGLVHTLTLTVTDSGGQQTTATRRIRIWTLC